MLQPTTTLNKIIDTTVLVRVNYDLPSLEDTDRIVDSLATIQTLLEQGNKVVLCTHWGRPVDNDLKFSTSKLIDILEYNLGDAVVFVDQYKSFEEAQKIIIDTHTSVILLENTRYNPDEKSKDTKTRLNLAKQYARLCTHFVDEAFAVSHRSEATNTEIKSILPFSYGVSYQNEISNLSKLTNPKAPFVAIMGGAKLETKLPMIQKILPKVDKIIVAGLLCFTFIVAKKQLGETKSLENLPEIYDSLVEQDFIETAKQILTNYPDKIVLPVDFIYHTYGDKKYAFDINTKTLELFQNTLSDAKTIFWNGPMGYYEKQPYDQGTLKLGRYIVSLTNCFKVVGGGDTGSALPIDISSKLDFISMGGGATMEYLSQE